MGTSDRSPGPEEEGESHDSYLFFSISFKKRENRGEESLISGGEKSRERTLTPGLDGGLVCLLFCRTTGKKIKTDKKREKSVDEKTTEGAPDERGLKSGREPTGPSET